MSTKIHLRELQDPLIDGGLQPIIGFLTRQLGDTGGNLSINWDSKVLFYAGGVLPSVHWGNAYLADAGGVPSVTWSTKKLYDGAVDKLSWSTGILKNAANIPVFDWENGFWYYAGGTFKAIDLQNSQLSNSAGTPTVKWGAETLDNAGAPVLNWNTKDLIGAWTLNGSPISVSSGVPNPILALLATTFNGTTWSDQINPAGVFTSTGVGVTKSGNYIGLAGTDQLVGNAGAQPIVAAGKNVTLSLWLNFTSIIGDIRPFDSGAADGQSGAYLFDMNLANNRPAMFYTDNTNAFYHGDNTSEAVATGVWLNFVAVIDRLGTQGAPAIHLYKNGQLITTDATNMVLNSLQIGTGAEILHLFGGFLGGNNMIGLGGDIRLWGVALSASDVMGQYLASKQFFP